MSRRRNFQARKERARSVRGVFSRLMVGILHDGV
jgi:hypothetical protein